MDHIESHPAAVKMAERTQWLSNTLRDQQYIADKSLLSSLYLMDALEKPLLLEGDAGVGKTAVASCLAAAHNTPLIRLQCYEGLGPHQALYDWDYPRQLLAIQMASESDKKNLRKTIYSDEFLLKRPLLAAISSPTPAVLLIDEIDRADEEFEALLLEILSDFQISIPELGTFKASSVPRVILTSNGVRELSDALRRRCLFHYIDFPDFRKELSIVQARLPDISQSLARQLVSFVQTLRTKNLRKTPGIAESLDWAMALSGMGISGFQSNRELIDQSLSTLLKTQEDAMLVREQFEDILNARVGSGSSQ